MKKARFKKGSAAAKAFMAKLRSMQGGKRKMSKAERSERGRKAARKRSSFSNPRSITQAEFSLNQLRNKGRKIAKAAKIKPFFFTGRKPQIVVSEGEYGMSRKRKTRKRARVHGFEGRTRKYHGRRTTHRRRSRKGLIMGGIGSQGIVPMLTQGAIGAAGAIGSAFIASKIPGVSPKFKPAIPLALAVALLMFGKKIPMSKAIAFGCVVSGAMGFVKQFAPNVPLLAGVDSAPELTGEEMTLLGAPQTFGSVQELTGAVSPADI